MQDSKITQPLVSIIIPHFGSSQILYDCLDSVALSTHPDFEVIIVDNGSDLREERLESYLFRWHLVRAPRNLGFAGGCNAGIKRAAGKYILLLNNDTTVAPGWLEPLVELMESDELIAACQPKLISSRFTGRLDYAGAMGGLIDIFGYPFAIGRIFEVTEPDSPAYDGRFKIFWASGTASIWRKKILDKTGLLDEDFFAHMEEIDLNWRCLLSGYHIMSTSKSVVFHYSGFSLGHDSWRKMYLNHRNNLIMLLKNLEGNNLLWIFPIRLFLEYMTIFMVIFKLDWRRLFAVIAAQIYILWNIFEIIKKRKVVQSMRKVSDTIIFKTMFGGSIIWHYFVRRHKRVSKFMEIKPVD